MGAMFHTLPLRRLAGVLLAALFASPILIAQAPALDLRMGYWEITSTMTMSGTPPALNADGLSPERKAQQDEMMKAMMKPHTVTDKQCITREDFNKGMLTLGQGGSEACQQAINVNTRTVLEGTITCKGDTGMSGTMRLEAPNSSTMIGVMKGSTAAGGTPMAINVTMRGTFVSATCPKE